MLLELLIMCVKVTKFIRQDICVWHEVKVLPAKPFLHPYYVIAKPVLPSDFIALWKVIDLLVFIEAFIEVRLAAA